MSDDSQSYPSVPNNTLDIDDVSCAKSEWDMLSVAVAMYELYWFESRQKDADSSSKRRRTKVKMPPPRRENTIVQIANAGPQVPGGGVTLKRRCTYRPSVIYLMVNKLLSPPHPSSSSLFRTLSWRYYTTSGRGQCSAKENLSWSPPGGLATGGQQCLQDSNDY